MSADELRKAAETLRASATSATAGPWVNASEEEWCDGPSVGAVETEDEVVSEWGVSNADATYIATMHPGVGLALADVLEAVIELDWASDDWPEFGALARLINGGV